MDLNDIKKLETDINGLIEIINGIAVDETPSLFHVEKAERDYQHLLQKLEKIETKYNTNTLEFQDRLSALREDFEFCKNLLATVKERT